MKHHQQPSDDEARLQQERLKLLRVIELKLEIPMVVLGFLWLILLIIELIRGLNPTLETASAVIWVVFILDFSLKFILAPAKISFLKSNIIVLISLVIPAFRIFRITRVLYLIRTFRMAGSLRLVKVLGSFNRGMKSLGATVERSAFAYVLLLTLIVLFIASAGIFAFERHEGEAFSDYGKVLWWTAMLLSSIGTENWPRTAEGRVLTFFLALYGLAVFSYITAMFASFLVGRGAEDETAEVAGAKQVKELSDRISEVDKKMDELLQKMKKE